MSNLRHLVANARNLLYTCQGVNKKYTFFSRAVCRTFYRAPYHGTKIRCPCKMASETKTQFMQPKEKRAGVKPHTRAMAIYNVARPIVPLLWKANGSRSIYVLRIRSPLIRVMVFL